MDKVKTTDKLSQSSKIVDFYSRKNIFITGGSGFVGKALIEKLLRSCSNLNKIYILLRPKKGQIPKKRLDKEFTDNILFKEIDRNLIRSKLVPLEGDLTSDRLGLSADDAKEVCSNVHVVFHLAATVRFDDPLKESVRYNVLGTKYVIELCHQITGLESFVHVSTAYAYCHLNKSEECLYPLRAPVSQVLSVCEIMDDKTLKRCTEFLAEGRPNTYTFSKAMAEHYVNENRGNLPVAIARPSIVTASLSKPLPGWVDSMNGLSFVTLHGALGIGRIILCDSNKRADLIPVDIVANSLIVIAWQTAIDYRLLLRVNSNNNSNDDQMKQAEIPVYNVTCGDVNSIKWGQLFEDFFAGAIDKPSIRMLRTPNLALKGGKVNFYEHKLTRIVSEILFACVVDFISLLTGQKALMLQLVLKMHNTFDRCEYFASREWSFPRDNLQSIYNSLDESDQKLFLCDVQELDWRTYNRNCYIGVRRHLLNESDDNLPKTLKRMQRLKIGYAIAKIIGLILIVLLVFKFLTMYRMISLSSS